MNPRKFFLVNLRFVGFLFCICAYSGILATSLHVGTSFPYTSIKAALAHANKSDSIFVHPGNYSEGNIVIDKEIKLIGINYPILDGGQKVELISVKASHVTVSGFKLINSAFGDMEDFAAIKVYDRQDVKISNNRLENNFFGIYLSNSKNCTISTNSILSGNPNQHSSGNGIHLWHCDHVLIENNHIRGHRDGIYFEFVTTTEIRNNISEENLRYGLHFMFSNDDVYQNNTFRDNGAGVAVMFSSKVKMLNNHFEHNWGESSYGLLLKEIRDSEIFGNLFEKNSMAITMEGATRILITTNNFIQNGWAMKLSGDCLDCIITKNNIIGNTFDVSTTGTTTENDFNGNYWDKYEGYDLNKDGLGDTPFYPISLSTLIMDRIPASLLFLHSFILALIDQSEKIAPQLVPLNICDNRVAMKKL